MAAQGGILSITHVQRSLHDVIMSPVLEMDFKTKAVYFLFSGVQCMKWRRSVWCHITHIDSRFTGYTHSRCPT